MYGDADAAPVPGEGLAPTSTETARPTWLVAGVIGAAVLLYVLTAGLRRHDRRAAQRHDTPETASQGGSPHP
jgi:hypothetical protein